MLGWETFDVAAIVDELPADRGNAFDGMMRMSDYTAWLYSHYGPTGLSRDRTAPAVYERAAVYFNEGNYAALNQYLTEHGFEFDRDMFQKFGRLLAIASITATTAG